MLKRSKMNPKASKKLFTKTALKVHQKNHQASGPDASRPDGSPMRGGIRL